jgi:hypothetical protein
VHYTIVEETSPDAESLRVRQLGRRLGIVLYAVIVATFTIICSVEICLQVWAPKLEPLPVGCAAGTLLLIDAIDAARLAAADEPGEQAALAKFRSALASAWTSRPALSKACASDPEALRRLRAVDRLRYAEEHAIRYAAVDLAQRRHEVKRLIPTLRQTAERTL